MMFVKVVVELKVLETWTWHKVEQLVGAMCLMRGQQYEGTLLVGITVSKRLMI